MKKQFGFAAAFAAAMALSGAAYAGTVTNTALASPGYYNGSGNPNEGFTVDTEGTTEIGLGVLYRKSGPQVHPTSGSTYNVSTGYYNYTVDYCTGSCAKWNIEFSVNLGADSGLKLNDITSLLTVKNLTTLASSSFDPLSTFSDNAGWNGTKNTANSNLATDYGFQNSENLAFSEFAGLGFNPLENTSYLVTFTVNQVGGGQLASVQATINATPLPAALPLFASGLGALGVAGWRRKRKAKAAA